MKDLFKELIQANNYKALHIVQTSVIISFIILLMIYYVI